MSNDTTASQPASPVARVFDQIRAAARREYEAVLGICEAMEGAAATPKVQAEREALAEGMALSRAERDLEHLVATLTARRSQPARAIYREIDGIGFDFNPDPERPAAAVLGFADNGQYIELTLGGLVALQTFLASPGVADLIARLDADDQNAAMDVYDVESSQPGNLHPLRFSRPAR